MSENNNNFIEQLKAHTYEVSSKGVYVPSLEREIKFSTLTAKHQKYFIHATLDNPLLNLIFHQKSYDIIKDLCSENGLVDNFNIIDKHAILIQLRYHFVSDKYNGASLNPVINFIKKIKLDLSPKVDVVDGVSIQYQIPTILQENRILKEYGDTVKHSMNPTDEDEIRCIIADAYILEIVKYINKVQLVSNNSVVDFNNHSYSHIVDVVDVLGKRVCDKVHDYINNVKSSYKGMYFVKNKEIEINASLFN